MIVFDSASRRCQVIKSIIRWGSPNGMSSKLVHLDEDTDTILKEMRSDLVDPRTYILEPYANIDECIVFGYGYGKGTSKSPVRDSDDLDDVIFIRPWNSGDAVYRYDLDRILYHNKWRHVEFEVDYSLRFRLYLKYGNGKVGCYIKNVKINGNPRNVYPDLNASIVYQDGKEVVKLPPDWSKVFLISEEDFVPQGKISVSFDYYVEDNVGVHDLPDPPRSIYGEITVEELDTTNEAWMHNLPFESAEKMQEAYKMGESAYLRTLPDDNKKLTEQITALEMAIVDLYEGGLR